LQTERSARSATALPNRLARSTPQPSVPTRTRLATRAAALSCSAGIALTERSGGSGSFASVSRLVSIAIFVWFLGIAAWFVPYTWRNGRTNSSGRQPVWWPYGDAGWLAYARFIPTGGVGACLGTASEVVTGTLSTALLFAMLACFVVAWSIIAFNHPKRLVPPARRADPGLLTSWWGDLRARFR